MGDRGNIQIHQPKAKEDIFLYTHWTGSYINPTLALGLAKAKASGRLNDPAYATRIIFDTLTNCEGQDTGYGISLGSPCDNEHDIPLVYWPDDWGKEPTIFLNGVESSVDEFIAYWGKGIEEWLTDWVSLKTFAGQMASWSAS
jgi:hypothetical protein